MSEPSPRVPGTVPPEDRRWVLLALTCIGAFMAPLDGSIVAVALPRMGPALS